MSPPPRFMVVTRSGMMKTWLSVIVTGSLVYQGCGAPERDFHTGADNEAGAGGLGDDAMSAAGQGTATNSGAQAGESGAVGGDETTGGGASGGGTAVLGAPCDADGTLGCNGPASKLSLLCEDGEWKQNDTCSASQNCDRTNGVCTDVIPECSSQQPGHRFCDESDGLLECGPDLVTKTLVQTCDGRCVATGGTADCASVDCGDSKLQDDEECDDGNEDETDACSNTCKKARCGDGLVQTRIETCDDGNETAKDGCSAVCQLEAGWECSMLPSVCTDIDECALEQDNCDVAARCTNKPGTFECRCSPGFLPNGTACESRPFAVGNKFACAAKATGSIACWGDNARGQLGTGGVDLQPHTTPTVIAGLSGVVQLGAGQSHACALLSNGKIKCWGMATYGQIGDGTRGDGTYNRPDPVEVQGLGASPVQVSVGGYHSCAVLDTGAVKCWGWDKFGQIGDNSKGDADQLRLNPVAVSGLSSGVVAVAGGGLHTCALMKTGAVKCWGSNLRGQLGDGTKGDADNLRLTPVDVVGLNADVVQITAGGANTCAVLSSGLVQCWGSLTGDLEPATVGDLSEVVQASLGDLHACFVLETGGAKCWGFNESGQIGDDTLVLRAAPVDVRNLSAGANKVQVGQDHSCVLMEDGQVKCWGKNDLGQIGSAVPTGTAADALSKVPVLVSVFP